MPATRLNMEFFIFIINNTVDSVLKIYIIIFVSSKLFSNNIIKYNYSELGTNECKKQVNCCCQIK
jgi:hypothetical protein